MSDAPLVSIDANPRPPNGKAVFVTNGDVRLRVARWPARGEAKGTVILANGRTEFIEKYFEVIGELLDRGYEVLTFDWRGQGLSTRELEARERGHVKSFDDYFADLDAIFASPIAQNLPEPRFLVAHSMGGNITFRYVQMNPNLVRRALFNAPMFGIVARAAQPALHAMGRAAVMLGQGEEEPFFSKPAALGQEEFEINPVTSDRERFERTKKTVAAEPDLWTAGLSWDWAVAAFDSVAALWQPSVLENYRTPSLLIGAGREKLVTPDAPARLAKHVQPCEAVTIEGAKHEIMMERDPFRRQFWALFDEFMSRG